jgi:hypothetical protein
MVRSGRRPDDLPLELPTSSDEIFAPGRVVITSSARRQLSHYCQPMVRARGQPEPVAGQETRGASVLPPVSQMWSI